MKLRLLSVAILCVMFFQGCSIPSFSKSELNDFLTNTIFKLASEIEFFTKETVLKVNPTLKDDSTFNDTFMKYTRSYHGFNVINFGNMQYDLECNANSVFKDTIHDNIITSISYIFRGEDDDKEYFEKEAEAIFYNKLGEKTSNIAWSLNDKYNIILHDEDIRITIKDDLIYELQSEVTGEKAADLKKEADTMKEAYLNQIKEKVKNEQDIEENRALLVTAAQQEVKERLKAPSTAKFPLAEYKISKKESGNYIIAAYVDSQNSYGAMLRSDFSVEIKLLGGNDYRVISVDIQQ